MNTIRKLALAALAITAVSLPAVAADEAADLTVDKLKIRSAKKGDKLDLSLTLPPDSAFQSLDMTTAPMRILVGDVAVFVLPPAGERSTLSDRGFLRYRYRDGRKGPKLLLDLGLGRVKFTAKKLDLATVIAESGAGLRVRVEIDDLRFESVVDVKQRRRVLKQVRPITPVLPPGQDPGIDISFTVREIENGEFSGIEQAEFTVARTPAEWRALWDRHQGLTTPPAALPDVDFAQEMVVGAFFGDRPDPSHSIEFRRARSGAAGLYFEIDDVRVVGDGCFFPSVVTQPFVLLRVPRYDTVLFKSRIVQRGCRE